MNIRGILKSAYAGAGSIAYRLRGRRPWSFGYAAYKRAKIEQFVNDRLFDAQNLEAGHGDRLDERIVEYPWFFSRLPERPGALLDAGSILNYEFLLKHAKLANKRIFISTLAPEAECFWGRGISYVFEDLRDSYFRDACFDWVVSLSTVEHIGMDNTMLYTGDETKRESDGKAYLRAIEEFARVLKPGGTLFLSVPFGLRKDHGWFQIFDAPMVDQLVAAFGPSSVIERHFRYAAGGWVGSTREQSGQATYFDIHEQKEYDADFAAASRAVVCLEMTR